MRRLLLACLFVLAFLAALAAGLVVVRQEVAEVAIRHGLASEGIHNASFRVVDVTTDSARVEDIALGRYRNLQVHAVEVSFSGLNGWLPWTWKPEIREIRLIGLRLKLNTESDNGPLDDPELDRLLSGPEEAEVGEASAIPPIVLENAEISLTDDDGETRLKLDGSVARPLHAALSGHFSYAIATPLGEAKGEIELFQAPEEAMRVSATAEGASLHLDDARIEALTAAVELTLPEDELPKASGQLSIRGISPLAGYVEQLSVNFSADPSRFDIVLAAKDAAGGSVGSGRVAITRLDSRPQIDARLTVNAVHAGSHLGLVEEGGELTVESELSATLPPLVDLIHDRGGKLIQLLETGSLATRLKISAKDLTVPGKVLGLSAGLHLNLLLEDAKLRAWVAEESQLSVSALDPEWSLLALLPDDTRGALWRNLVLTLPLQGEAGLQASAQRSSDGDEGGINVTVSGPLSLTSGLDTRLSFSGRLDSSLAPDLTPRSLAFSRLNVSAQALPILGNRITSLSLTGDALIEEKRLSSDLLLDASLAEARQDDLLLGDVTLRLPLSLRASAEETSVNLDEPGRIGIGKASLAGESLLQKPASLKVERIALARDPDKGWLPRLGLTAETLALTLPGDGSNLDVSGLSLDLAGTLDQAGLEGAVTLGVERVALPAQGLSLTKLKLEMPLPPERLESEAASLSFNEAALQSGEQNFSGIAMTASITRKGETYRLTGKGSGPGGQGRLAVSLQHDVASGRGSLDASWGPVTFAKDGLQPKSLSTALEDLTEVTGEVSLEAKGEWSPRSSNISAKLGLTSLSATLLPAQINGLNGDLTFPSVNPLVTLKDQTITIDELDVGVPLSDLLLTFEVADTSAGPALDSKTLQTDFAGGRLQASPFRITGPDDAFSTTVEVSHVKLDQLAEILDLGDIELEGRIIGQIPLTLDLGKESVVIANGWLQAVDGGVIRIPNAADRLGLGDISKEQKDLFFALDALADFHFTYLYATIAFGADGELDLALTLEGNNPAVLEGYPFKFNVTFSVDLTDLIAAFQRGQQITSELFDGAWSLKN